MRWPGKSADKDRAHYPQHLHDGESPYRFSRAAPAITSLPHPGLPLAAGVNLALPGEELQEGVLMPEVRWSREAKAKLGTHRPRRARPAHQQRGQDLALHPACPSSRMTRALKATVMWHRGIACGMLSEELLAQEDDDGPWNYFLFYRPGRSGH